MCKFHKKKAFIFGAGSSVHVAGPLNKEWIGIIKKNEKNIEKHSTAISFLDSLPGYDNIEGILTLIDLSIMEQYDFFTKRDSFGYLKKVQSDLLDCIKNVADEITEKAVEDLLLRDFFVKAGLKKGDTVINFNYDLVVDNGLYMTRQWNPYLGVRKNVCGYGFGIPFVPGQQEEIKNISNSKIQFLKLHGSTNWVECDSEDEVKLQVLDWDRFNPVGIHLDTYCKPFNNFIIIPSFVKMYEEMPLRMLWLYAHKSISEASEIYIIGYSFPKADILSRQLLLHASDSVKRIIVIDPLPEGCREIDKREDINSMLPWRAVDRYWFDKIEIKTQTLEQYLKYI